MSLQDWCKAGWLVAHQSSRDEVRDLLAVADRDIADCQTPGLSADWRLNIAYNAALQLAVAVLGGMGYRATRDSHHFRVIQSLAHTVAAQPEVIKRFEHFRKKRNQVGYERAGMTSDQEAREMLDLARKLREMVMDWIQANHPEWM